MVILVDFQEKPQHQNPLRIADAEIIIERFQDAKVQEVTEWVLGQP